MKKKLKARGLSYQKRIAYNTKFSGYTKRNAMLLIEGLVRSQGRGGVFLKWTVLLCQVELS